MYNITSREVYECLVGNKEILNIYKRIEDREISGGGYAFHNLEHVLNVSSLAQKILIDLKFNEDMIYNCMIACFLHDVGAIDGKDGHAFMSYAFALKLFRDNNWIFPDMDSVLFAIRDHSDGFDSDNILTLAIILADKLDIKKSRISPVGRSVIGNRQYSHILDIVLNICDGVLNVNFITDGNIDIDEVNNYYFTSKVFKAISSFSNMIGLDYRIFLDGSDWSFDKVKVL